jgi:hypothetical protein
MPAALFVVILIECPSLSYRFFMRPLTDEFLEREIVFPYGQCPKPLREHMREQRIADGRGF